MQVVVEIKLLGNPKLLPDIADQIKGKLGDPAVVVLGVPGDGQGQPARRRDARARSSAA